MTAENSTRPQVTCRRSEGFFSSKRRTEIKALLSTGFFFCSPRLVLMSGKFKYFSLHFVLKRKQYVLFCQGSYLCKTPGTIVAFYDS
jgi:hypothetical protein